MTDKKANNFVCKAHSGILSDIEHLEESDTAQWKEINAMKSRSIIILTSVVVTLIGVITNLVVLLIK